jgi:CO/xanthine dehydrogenase FAD-binding subunit
VQYVRVKSESELAEVLRTPGAVPFAGGTDLMVKIRSGLTVPGILVDLSRIESLRGVDEGDTAVRIGAATPEAELLDSPTLRERAPLLPLALRTLGSVQIRNRGTLGGNLANASPAADSAIPLLLYDAQLALASTEGERCVELDQFFVGPGKTILRPGEYIRSILLPALASSDGEAVPFFHKVGKRRALTISIASLGSLLHLEGERVVDARVAAGSVAPTPIRLRRVERRLEGEALTDKTIADAAGIAEAEVSPIDDVRATAGYRREVIGALLVRSLERARSA